MFFKIKDSSGVIAFFQNLNGRTVGVVTVTPTLYYNIMEIVRQNN